MLRVTGSRRFRIVKTTINKTAMPIVNSVPVSKVANGKIDKPPPSVNERERKKINGDYLVCNLNKPKFYLIEFGKCL